MNIILYAVLGLLLSGALLTGFSHRKIDVPEEAILAQAQVNEYQMFMLVADLYMRTYSGGPGVITWSTLNTASGAPSGAVGMKMPSNWKVVVASDMTWVACTPMDERALGIIQQRAAPNGLTPTTSTIAGQDYVVMGAAADAGKASLCS